MLILHGTLIDDAELAIWGYSYVSDNEAIHVASVHTWNEKDKTLTTVPGSGGVSSARSELEGAYAWAWAVNIWQDVLT